MRQTDKVALLISAPPPPPLTKINFNGRKATEADASPDQPLPSLSSSSSSPSSFRLSLLSFSSAHCSRSGRSDITYPIPAAAASARFSFFMIIIPQLWQAFSAIKGPFIEFLFPEKKNMLISLKATVLLMLLPKGD